MKAVNFHETMGFSFIRPSSSFVRLFLISLILSTFFSTSVSTPVVNDEVCESPWCQEIATQMKKDMNESANPCDDFYEYMCGGFVQNNQIPENEPEISQLLKVDERTILRLREILDSPAGKNDPESLKNAKKIYNMCQDTETLDSLGISPLVNFVNRIGGWPITKYNENKTVSWQEVFKMDSMAYSVIGIHVEQDLKNTDKNIIWLVEPSLFLSSEEYLNPEEHRDKLDEYRDLITNVVKAFVNATGTSVPMESIRKDVEDIIEFETKLTNISQSYQQANDILSRYAVMTIDELQRKFDSKKQLTDVSKIDWLSMIRHYFSSSNININGTEEIAILSLQYILQLPEILDKTSHRTVVNFLQWQLIRNTLRYFNNNAKETLSEYQKLVYGVKEKEKRWRKCLQLSPLDTALSYEYVRKYFSPSTKQEIRIIVENIKEVVEKKISQAKWMDEETKNVSIDKLRNIKAVIGYPHWLNATAIDLHYDRMKITSNYFESIINANTYEAIRQLRKLREPVNKNEVSFASFDVNAYYSLTTNIMSLPAGSLQAPMFDPSRSSAMNYGVIGSIIGHEISHAFDNNGRKFNKDGSSVQWWTNYTIDKYEAIEKCFVDQYNQYTIPELLKINKTVHLNGNLTAGENIADSEGIIASYEAFKKRFNYSKQKEIKLPGFERFTADQMFFMSFANTYCEKSNLTVLEESVEYSHPPQRFRVRGALSNFPKFAESFNCPLGSPMNPQKKCSLWK